jgi:DDE superfamily endonuclease
MPLRHNYCVVTSVRYACRHSVVLSFIAYKNVSARLPSHTSHKFQLCDAGVFGPLKTPYREHVEELYHGGENIIGKQHFTLLYDHA